ncbi:uncharacterized protein LOC127079916 [Lathyrus oleraceus]|nr:uncharacterized protein LOC127079916 [Pisum sativum]
MENLCILKKFNISIHPPKVRKTINVLWQPPNRGWIKCNIDNFDIGVPSFCSCGGIFRNDAANLMGSFVNFLGDGNVLLAELSVAMTAMEIARERKWNNLWIGSNSAIMVKAFTNFSLFSWKVRSKWANCICITHDINFLIPRIFKKVNGCADSLVIIDFMFKTNY